MIISNLKYQEDGVLSAIIDGVEWSSITPQSRYWPKVQEWIAAGNTPDPYVPPQEPTLDQIYDQAVMNSRVLKALILALNDGSFVPGSGYTNQQIKNGIIAKL